MKRPEKDQLPADPDRIVHSPSGWSYRGTQENGDQVDCYECGNALNDDQPIVNDDEGYAYHARCHGENPEPAPKGQVEDERAS